MPCGESGAMPQLSSGAMPVPIGILPRKRCRKNGASFMTDIEEPSLLCTRAEARNHFRISDPTLDLLIESGELQSIKIGRARRIIRSSLDSYIERRLEAAS